MVEVALSASWISRKWIQLERARMTSTNLTLYRLLVKFGASEADAEAAVAVDLSALATKQDLLLATTDLQKQIIDLERQLAWKIGGLIIGAMVSMTGLFALIVAWMTRAH